MLTILDQEAATKAMIANERKKAAREAKIQTAVEMCHLTSLNFEELLFIRCSGLVKMRKE